MLTEEQKSTLDSAYENAKNMKEDVWHLHMLDVAKRIDEDNYIELFKEWFTESINHELSVVKTEEIINKLCSR